MPCTPVILCVFHSFYSLHFVIHAHTHICIWTHIRICNFYMRRMLLVALQHFLVFQRCVKHNLCIRRCKRICSYMHLKKSRHLTCQAFQMLLHICKDLCLLVRKIICLTIIASLIVSLICIRNSTGCPGCQPILSFCSYALRISRIPSIIFTR